jgi:hypothetical protein
MPSMEKTQDSRRSLVASILQDTKYFLILVFIFALLLRLAAMVATKSYHIGNEIDDHFGFGTEMGRVARSIAQGQGFSSPMPLPTGPTAIVGPLYPLLMALVFKVFGIYSTGSAVVILALQCLFSSLTCLFIYLCGRDTVGETAGKLAAIVWAVFPLNLLFSVTRIWETSLTGMLAVALFWYMLSVRQSLSISRWATAGALFAIAGLVNTSLIVLAVPFALSAVWTNRTRFIRPLIAAALGGAAFLSPWLIRNYLQFGKPMLRSNFALEFRVGNNELSYGQKVSELHPARSLELNQRWQEVGEKRFMAEESDLNSKFVSAHPRLFAFYTLNRIVNYWTGGWIAPTKEYPNSLSAIAGISGLSLLAFLGVYRMFTGGNSAAPMFAGCFIIYPCVYYITTSQPRFYHSIAPMLILCGAFCLVDLKNKIAISRRAQDHVLPERSAHAVSDTL